MPSLPNILVQKDFRDLKEEYIRFNTRQEPTLKGYN